MSECRTSDGRAKKRFATRAAAKQSVRAHERVGHDVEGMKPYRCSECSWFHLGHYPVSLLKREALRRRRRDGVA